MKIIRLESGFVGAHTDRKKQFFDILEKYKGEYVSFRGAYEQCCFYNGRLYDCSGDTITFLTGGSDAMSRREWVYPYWEVIVAVEPK